MFDPSSESSFSGVNPISITCRIVFKYGQFRYVRCCDLTKVKELGSVNLLGLDWHFKNGESVRIHGRRMVHIAEIVDQRSKFTAITYEGEDAQEIWEKDFKQFSRASGTQPQLYGINRSDIPMLIFHGDEWTPTSFYTDSSSDGLFDTGTSDSHIHTTPPEAINPPYSPPDDPGPFTAPDIRSGAVNVDTSEDEPPHRNTQPEASNTFKHVHGDQVNYNNHILNFNEQALPRLPNSDFDQFQYVTHGVVDLLGSDWHSKNRKSVRIRGRNLISTVKIHSDRQSKFTAMIYEGKDAQKAWEKDFMQFYHARFVSPSLDVKFLLISGQPDPTTTLRYQSIGEANVDLSRR